MKRLLPFFLCLLGLACSYHGVLRRGIYSAPITTDKINARVLVVTDQFIPAQITVLHPYKKGKYRFRFDTADSVAVATADALGDLFTDVDAGPAYLASSYDYTVYVHYEVIQVLKSETKGVVTSELLENIPLEQLANLTGLHTYMRLSLQRTAEDAPFISLHAAKHRPITYRENIENIFRWPRIITPFSVQRRGNIIRHWLETDITESLQQIMQQLQQKQILFSPANAE